MNKMKYILGIIFTCLPVFVFGQVIVTGTLTSDVDGELIGVQVLEVDKNNRNVSATITDFSGNFSLQVKNTDNNIRFSYVGYKTITLPIKDRRRFDVKMEDDTRLAEVVITARARHSDGTISIPQREISGAVQKINTKEFEGISVTSIDDALQGRIAGLDIVGNSGNLGSGSTLRIRGTSTLNANAEPLIVVNDVPFENNITSSFDYNSANAEQFANLLSINPNDIEEIVVLKDGSSTAIWGSRGANGVISIRTKKGVKGPTRTQYSYRFSGKKQPRGLKMLNGDDYTMMMKQAYFNPHQNEEDANKPEYNYDPSYSEYEQFNNNTDWVDELTKYGFNHEHNLTISGGGDKARFRVSLGYNKETGTVIKQDLDRFTGRLNLDYQVSDRILFSSDFAITHVDNNKNLASDVGDGWNTENLLSMAYRKMPNVSVYEQDANGNNTNTFYTIPQSSTLNSSQKDLLNPVALAHLATNDEKQVKIVPKLAIRYDILDPEKSILRYNGWVQFDFENMDTYRFLPREVTSKNWDDELVNKAYSRNGEAMDIFSDQNLTYIPSMGEDHSLTLYGSWQAQIVKTRSNEFERYGLPSSEITDPTAEGYDKTFKSESKERRRMAFLARVHYAYKGKYILDGSIRRDADTRFGSNNRWGNFPAGSFKWIMSDENFMEPTKKWLSEFGIRGGFGIVGNAPGEDYLYFSRYNGDWGGNGNNYINIPTIKPASIKLANLKWEKSTSYNAGLDIHLLDYKIYTDLNVYTRRTEDLLVKDLKIAGNTGFTSLSYLNAGTIDNTGWELNIQTTKLLQAKDWTFDVNLNFANSKNEFAYLSPSFQNAFNSDFNYKNGYESYLSRVQENNAYGSIYGFRYKGVYQYDQYVEGREGTSPYARDAAGNVIKDNNGDPIPMYFGYGTTSSYRFRGGDAIYEDINNDGTIDELDIVYLGNSNPKLTGGFGTTIRYKRFSMNAFFVFRYGNKIVNRARMEAENMYTENNQSRAVNWRWRKDGDITDMPRALFNYGYNSLGSDRYVEDGSFLRFKYLTFMYDFESNMLRSLMLTQLNVYLTLNNIVTFTKYTGVDPEISQNSSYNDRLLGVSTDNNSTPRSQYFTLGITVGF